LSGAAEVDKIQHTENSSGPQLC